MLFTFKIEAPIVCRYCGSKLALDKAPQWGKKAKQKNGVKQQKKTFPSQGYRSARFAVQIYLHFFFYFTQSGAWSQAIGKSTTKKNGPSAYTNILPLYGARISRYPGNDLFSGCKEQSLPALTRLSTTICHKNKPKSEAFINFQLNKLLNLNY